MQSVDYAPARGTVSSWGDSYGRVDWFLAGTAYLAGTAAGETQCGRRKRPGCGWRGCVEQVGGSAGELEQEFVGDAGGEPDSPCRLVEFFPAVQSPSVVRGVGDVLEGDGPVPCAPGRSCRVARQMSSGVAQRVV
ncbi:hypothetical protein ACIQ6Y_32115 [Streptomyces sp. NPDC096205]|uniref:rhamnogalacturonan lyase family protein n=1 Tax=Streptomyces sp. NPDC096205 TaxID=3366081 RepID=UPI00380850B7